MATATQVPAKVPFEVYLRSEFEPTAEYVNGEILERPMGELNHADWQDAISAWFRSHANQWNIWVFPELRVLVTKENFRIPDVTVLDRAQPIEQTITRPPIAVFEVLSPEDTIKKMKHKLLQYAEMGIPQLWVVDPDQGTFERYEKGRLIPATHFDQGPIHFELAAIAEFLQA